MNITLKSRSLVIIFIVVSRIKYNNNFKFDSKYIQTIIIVLQRFVRACILLEYTFSVSKNAQIIS